MRGPARIAHFRWVQFMWKYYGNTADLHPARGGFPVRFHLAFRIHICA
ncbi:hypothetical protein J2S49_001386 [Arcanobacterium wilhelmae]|uniref:Uncharacterized protein n=1 Tax=Arcanobacterium wilhelmae TaxID=1803177 RepID=A0ABT9NC78_9ACTO|nr:hypothetical protein [Arcanobacterium wilhelmae]